MALFKPLAYAALIVACLVASASAACDPKVFLTEVVDSKNSKLRYVEIYNSGDAEVDLSECAHVHLLLFWRALLPSTSFNFPPLCLQVLDNSVLQRKHCTRSKFTKGVDGQTSGKGAQRHLYCRCRWT